MIWLNETVYYIHTRTQTLDAYNQWDWSVDVIPLWHIQFMRLSAKYSTHSTLIYDSNGKEILLKHHDAFRPGGEDDYDREPERTDEGRIIDSSHHFLRPAIDYVFSLDPHDIPSWNRELLQIAAEDNSKIIFGRKHLKREKDAVQEYAGLNNAMSGKSSLGLREDKRIICSRRAVLPAHRYHMFNSFAEAELFKMRVWNKLKVPAADLPLNKPRVLFKSQERNVLNYQGAFKAA